MGNLFTTALDKLRGKKEYRTLILGLDNAGKTCVLFRLAMGEMVDTVPTIGFNVETVKHKNVEFAAWDVGGQEKIRRLWRHYYSGTEALIFVVDSTDTDRIEDAREELHRLLAEDELKDVTLLVYANKQDAKGAMTPSDLARELGLHDQRSLEWWCQGCSALTGDGLFEGLDWMCTAMAKH